MAEYKSAKNVEKIAKTIIPQHHKHLESAEIAYLFRDPPAKNKGKTRFGKTYKVTGKYKEVTGLDFIIEIAEEPFFSMETDKQEALIDHELSHCDKNSNGKWVTINHDYEGFLGVLNRHGTWNMELRNLETRMKQMELPFGPDAPAETESHTVEAVAN